MRTCSNSAAVGTETEGKKNLLTFRRHLVWRISRGISLPPLPTLKCSLGRGGDPSSTLPVTQVPCMNLSSLQLCAWVISHYFSLIHTTTTMVVVVSKEKVEATPLGGITLPLKSLNSICCPTHFSFLFKNALPSNTLSLRTEYSSHCSAFRKMVTNIILLHQDCT